MSETENQASDLPEAPESSAPETPEPTVEATKAAVAHAEELGVDLSTVQGSGEGGKITKADVAAAAPPASAVAPEAASPSSDEETADQFYRKQMLIGGSTFVATRSFLRNGVELQAGDQIDFADDETEHVAELLSLGAIKSA